MKTTKFLSCVLIFIISTLFIACDDQTEVPKLVSAPEAKAAYDNNSGGVIKGVMVGSSGVFKFVLKNGNDSVYCTTTFDGASGMLTTTDLADWSPGEAIERAKFSGKLGSTDVVVYLSCAANGTAIVVDFQIAGHFIVSTPIKETSTQLVKAYEGTYKTTKISDNSTVDEGIFNFVLINNGIFGTRYSSTHSESRNIKGIVNGNTLTVDDKVMSIDDTKVSCNITISDGTEKLVVNGNRTL